MTYLLIALGLVVLVAIHDVFQRPHSILRTFPILGHFRYWLETVGPELRQYIVTNDDEERPFSRDRRRWIYASSKRENNYFGFGSDNEMERASNYLVIQHETLGHTDAEGDLRARDAGHPLPCAKVLGGPRGRAKAFRPRSLVNISAMSFGSLSGPSIEALNRGCAIAGALHNTGEGSISPHHLKGGELVWQVGTGYFGCRDTAGRFDLERLAERAAAHPVRAIEIKLSQGAKPGLGGILPAAKITPEIAAIRGIPLGIDCVSPPGHTAFDGVDGLLDFVELLGERTGLPIGIKSAVGELGFWRKLADLMADGQRGVDFITIDGGEGGTGAGPLAFVDHVALPFKLGFTRVYRVFAERGVQDRVAFIGSGKLGFPEESLTALALGCDLINIAREAMLSIGCIQAQRCHTGHCPTGVATQNRWLARGIDPTLKSARLAHYLVSLRKDLLHLAHACGVSHPALVGPSRIELLDDRFCSRTLREAFDYEPSWSEYGENERAALEADLAAFATASA